jgi:hypothetical protein
LRSLLEDGKGAERVLIAEALDGAERVSTIVWEEKGRAPMPGGDI